MPTVPKPVVSDSCCFRFIGLPRRSGTRSLPPWLFLAAYSGGSLFRFCARSTALLQGKRHQHHGEDVLRQISLALRADFGQKLANQFCIPLQHPRSHSSKIFPKDSFGICPMSLLPRRVTISSLACSKSFAMGTREPLRYWLPSSMNSEEPSIGYPASLSVNCFWQSLTRALTLVFSETYTQLSPNLSCLPLLRPRTWLFSFAG